MRYCKSCQEPITSRHKHVVFCSHKCANSFTANQRKRRINLQCAYCHGTFQVTPGDLRYRIEIKYCSSACSNNHRKEMKREIVVCDNCGTRYSKLISRIKDTNFCNNACMREYRKEHPPRKGNGNWSESGYTVSYVGNGKGRKEHIIIMEKLIGRRLRENECVHHIDGTRNNNRPENLLLTTISEHAKMHRNLKRKSF